MLLIIFGALFLQGAVPERYWYPLALLILICFALSLFGWEQGWLDPPKLSGLEIYLLAWLLIMIISGLTSAHRWLTIFALEKLLVSLLFFYLILWHFSSKAEEKLLLWFLFALPVLLSLAGLGLYFSKIPGPEIFPDNLKCVTATLVNHNNFAGLILLGFFLGIGLMLALGKGHRELFSETLAKRALLSVPLIILLLALAFSLSRSGWIAFGLAIIIFTFWLILSPRQKKFKNYFLIILSIIFLGMAFALFMERDVLKARAKPLKEFLVDPASGLDLTGRRMLWQSTVNMIKDHPWLGIGPGAFWAEYPSYRILGELHGESHSHNDLLQLTAETGLPSTLLFLLLCFQAFRQGRKNYREEMNRFERRVSFGIIFGIFAFCFQTLFDFHFHIPGLVYYFLALCAFLLKPRASEVRR